MGAVQLGELKPHRLRNIYRKCQHLVYDMSETRGYSPFHKSAVGERNTCVFLLLRPER